MTTYKSIEEAKAAAKEKGIALKNVYVVGNKQVRPAEFRQCERPVTLIYRSGPNLMIVKE